LPAAAITADAGRSIAAASTLTVRNAGTQKPHAKHTSRKSCAERITAIIHGDGRTQGSCCAVVNRAQPLDRVATSAPWKLRRGGYST
jgi:hypothetical protein